MKKLSNWLLLAVGLFFIAFGVGLIIRADMGVLPTTCLPFAVSRISGITVGEAVILFNGALILGQIFVLRKNYELFRLFQIVICLVFGYITDFVLFLLKDLNVSGNLIRWTVFLTGVLISAVGVSLEVISETATLATEGFVIAVSQTFPIRFGTMKIIFDVFLVLVSLIISWIFLHSIEGIGEGTILSAVLLGFLSKHIIALYQCCFDRRKEKKNGLS